MKFRGRYMSEKRKIKLLSQCCRFTLLYRKVSIPATYENAKYHAETEYVCVCVSKVVLFSCFLV